MKKIMAIAMVIALTIGATPVHGATPQKIDAYFGTVNLVVDGKPVDEQTLLYNDTTYVPLRAISEMLGKQVEWDENTKTAYIGEGAPTASESAKFDLVERVYDYGGQVEKVVIKGSAVIDGGSVDISSFAVETNNSVTGKTVENGPLTVKKAYVAQSADGAEAASGSFVVLELENGADVAGPGVLLWDDADFLNYVIDLKYIVTQNKPIKTADGADFKYSQLTQDKVLSPEVDLFTAGKSTSGLNYRDFKPTEGGKDGKHPLIIFFHGAGEGGSNNAATLLGNRGGLTYATPEYQEIFDNPYVLVPQSPTYWMPTLTLFDTLTLTGKDYTADIISMIKEYIKENPDIDTNRIYVCGASMGGYQTWETVAAEPSMFAAMFPMCTAYAPPEKVLSAVKNIPNWICHAETDNIIDCAMSRDAYNSLVKMGAKNVYYTEFPEIVWEGVEYSPHSSWVLVSNNVPANDKGQHIFEWVASQSK